MTEFVHLHVHSQYSMLDGAVKVKNLVKHVGAAARAKFARGLRLSLNGEASAASAAAAKKLRELLGPYRNGPCPVCVRYSSGSAVADVRLGDDWRVTPDDGLIAALGDWLKPENVEIVYA